MYFPDTTESQPYTLYVVWNTQTPMAKLAINTSAGVKLINFKLPNAAFSKPVTSYNQAMTLTNSIRGISNNVNRSRLFGVVAAGEYAKGWLNVQGVTPDKEIYTVFDKGTLQIGKQTENYSTLFLQGSKLSGMWYLRKIPNIFPQLFSGERYREISVLWKPSMQATSPNEFPKEVDCACPLKILKSTNSSPDPSSMFNVNSKLSSKIQFNSDGTFEGIAAAEGTWIDMFGTKYVYTPEFVQLLASRMQEGIDNHRLLVDREHMNDDKGAISKVSLLQNPINYVKVQGRYDGDTTDATGLSLELRLKSVWNSEFQAWVPYDAITDRVSIVNNPACNICWLNRL